jgi:exonuclease VII large subunit
LNSTYPQEVLSRGYAIVSSEQQGLLINSITQVEKNDDIKVRVADGNFSARVS